MAQLLTLHEDSETRVKLQKKMQELDVVVTVSTGYDSRLVPDTSIGFLDQPGRKPVLGPVHVHRGGHRPDHRRGAQTLVVQPVVRRRGRRRRLARLEASRTSGCTSRRIPE